MTQLIGRPDVPTGTPLRMTVTYTAPYPRGDALGLGTMTYTYDWTDARWEYSDGTVNSLIAARFGANDPLPPLLRILLRVGSGSGTIGKALEIPAAETAAGALNITTPLTNVPYVRGPELAQLIADAGTVTAAAVAATNAANTAAGQVNTALADIAQQQDANDARQDANDAGVSTALSRLAPLSGASYPNGVTVGGREVSWGFGDDTGRFWMQFDPTGKLFVWGGIDLSNVTGLNAETVTSAAEPLYIGEYQGVPLVQGAQKRVAQALLTDGRMYFPAGIVAPGLSISGMTTDADGGVRLNGVRIAPRQDIAGVGDSMTAAGYIAKLAALLSVGGYNLGIGSQTSAEIAARVDAGPALYATVTGGSIPASGSVTVDMLEIDVLRNAGNQSIPVWIAGVHGTLSRAGTPNAATQLTGYTFTRDMAGVAVAVTNPVQVRPDMTVKEDCTTLIRVGRNDVAYADAVDRVLDGTRRIVARLAPAKKRFLVLDVLTATSEGTDATGGNAVQRQRVLDINAALKKEWPYQYVPLRQYLVQQGGAANDTIAPAQSVDGVHLTDAVDQVSAVYLAKTMREKGWY